MTRYSVAALAAIFGGAGVAQGSIVINELLGSTSGSDWEFIELLNSGSSAIDISNYQVTLYESDSGSSFGNTDASSPYVVPSGTILGSGEFFVFANGLASSGFGITPDVSLADNAIENSSYTAILENSLGTNVFSVFVTDGGASDAANEGGLAITPDVVVGPDGSFLPAGFYLDPDGGTSASILSFSTSDLDGSGEAAGSPGDFNIPGTVIPEPLGASVSLMGLAGLFLRRRRVAL